MASSVFKETLVQALGRKYKGRVTEAQAEVLSQAQVKATDLAATFRLRSQAGLSELDIENFEEAASEYVDNIILNLANEDIEFLANQTSFRENKRSSSKIEGGAQLRDTKGRFMSPFALERLLNLSLYQYTQKNMGVNGQLVNRTGRLAHSGTVTGVEVERGNMSIYFTYMLYPYEVFENPARPEMNPTGRRSPVKLFSDAIYQALDQYVSRNSLDNLNIGIMLRGGRT